MGFTFIVKFFLRFLNVWEMASTQSLLLDKQNKKKSGNVFFPKSSFWIIELMVEEFIKNPFESIYDLQFNLFHKKKIFKT